MSVGETDCFDTHPAQVLRFVSIRYPNWDYFYRLAILASTFSHPPTVLQSNPRSALFHLHDTWLGVTGALREDPDNTVGIHPNEAVQQTTSRTQARECAGGGKEERFIPRAADGTRTRDRRVAHVVWISTNRDSARRDEDES